MKNLFFVMDQVDQVDRVQQIVEILRGTRQLGTNFKQKRIKINEKFIFSLWTKWTGWTRSKNLFYKLWTADI